MIKVPYEFILYPQYKSYHFTDLAKFYVALTMTDTILINFLHSHFNIISYLVRDLLLWYFTMKVDVFSKEPNVTRASSSEESFLQSRFNVNYFLTSVSKNNSNNFLTSFIIFKGRWFFNGADRDTCKFVTRKLIWRFFACFHGESRKRRRRSCHKGRSPEENTHDAFFWLRIRMMLHLLYIVFIFVFMMWLFFIFAVDYFVPL